MTLMAGTLIAIDATALPAGQHQAGVKDEPGQKPAPRRARVALAGSARAELTTAAEGTPTRREWIVVTPAQAAVAVTLPDGARVDLPDGRHVRLAPGVTAGLPVGASASIGPGEWDELRATIADVVGDPKRLADIGTGQSMDIGASSGATISVPWGASGCSLGGDQPRSFHVRAGGAIQIPAGSQIAVLARKFALPGGCDITVAGTGVLRIDRSDRAVTMLTIPGGDPSPSPDDPGDELYLPYPVSIVPTAGAKVTVNGMAHVTVPTGMRVAASYRETFSLSAARTNLRLPQGGDSLAGTVVMVVSAALVTMLGIGAQIGVAATLVGLSQANVPSRVIMGLLLLGATVFVLRYSVTAIKTLVDPEPGSSMSSTAGASFTL